MSAAIWHPFSSLGDPAPALEIVRGQGALLYTREGHTLIDGVASWWVNLHGHAHPRLAEVLYEQAQCLEHVIFASCTHPWAETLAADLLRVYPYKMARVFYSDNGSTAVEVAIKLALQYHYNLGKRKPTIIALGGAYHGDTFGSMSVSDRNLFNQAFDPWLFDAEHLIFPDAAHEAEALEQLANYLANKDVAAFIFEPLLQGAAGMRMYSAKWLNQALSMCQAAGVLCIADEVLTGFGRTGPLFACKMLTHAPDIVALSKGLTGGMMPLGATLCNQRIVEAFESKQLDKTFWHGHSYTAYPLACRVAIESLRMLEETPQQRLHIIQSHAEQVQHWASHPAVDAISSLGVVLAIRLRSAHKTGYDNPLRKQIPSFFYQYGVLLRPLGNVLYVLPPYVITPAQLEQVYKAIDAFLEQVG